MQGRTQLCATVCMQDMQRPLYMRPQDAIEYGVIDEIIQPDARKTAKVWQG